MYVVIQGIDISLKNRYRKLRKLLRKQREASFIDELNKILSLADIYVFHAPWKILLASVEYEEKPEYDKLTIQLITADAKICIYIKYEKKNRDLYVEAYTSKWWL
jgi:hypothetical protein